jgi:uncharacterized membrane protein (UPF0182 family)
MSRRQNAAVVAAFVGLVVLYAATNLPSLYADYLWFVSVGYDAVFLKVFGYRAAVFVVFALIAFVVLYASLRITVRNVRKHDPSYSHSAWYTVAVVVVAIAVGAAYSDAWETFLLFVNAEPFGTADPYFGRPIAFYVFNLPAYEAIVGYLLLLVFVSLLIAVAVYAYEFGLEEYEDAIGIDELDTSRIEFDPEAFAQRVSAYAYGHVTAIAGALLVVLSFNFYLSRLRLVYSDSGAVFGVGATEASITSPALLVLAFVAFVGGVAAFANAHSRLRDSRVLYAAVGAVIVVSLLGTAGAFVHQSYVVEPDEYNQEEQYLSNEIEFTRAGFALDRIDEREFDVSENLTREQIEDNPGTIDNLRLWDKRPLMQTYNEQNNLRTYYHFNDIKTDRYTFDGDLRQVYISTREIEFNALPEGSQSWVNEHLVYTHGMGFVMSPVSEVGQEGFPEYYVDQIPPRADVDLQIDQPRIYYGETTNSYNIVSSGTRELDYPRRGENAYYEYSGEGGVPVSSTFRKIAYALRFGDQNIYFSNSVTDDSRIQINRDLETRVNEIAPFLEYDDPYPAVVNGRVKWIYDAYTTTDRYPYSARYPFNGDRINYLRNSVKVVVDAYSGETTFYVTEGDDPIVNAYRNVFPSMFRDFDEMSPELRDHVRYPQDAFETQARVNLVYHMQNEQEFYNREDEWRIPNEEVSGQTVPVEPYYIVMKLPGEEEPEFMQILPFIPEARENLIGWMAARSDRPNYGEIESFLLSQQDLVFGPQQVESRIDQNTEISQSITLWSQAGSSVDRGNLLAVPIDDTILYVEPLFLEAQNEGALPQLQRVIVAHNDRVTMQRTLDASLAALFGETVAPPTAPGAPQPSTERIERLRELYDSADASLREGNFTGYARNIEEIGEVLDEFNTTARNETDAVPEAPTAPIDTPDTGELR